MPNRLLMHKKLTPEEPLPLVVAVEIAETLGIEGAAWWAIVQELSKRSMDDIAEHLAEYAELEKWEAETNSETIFTVKNGVLSHD